MRNKAPIFLNCFGKGGSNIFLNMFLTHPDLCYPLTETVEIFAVRNHVGLWKNNWGRKTTLEGYLVAILTWNRKTFNLWNLNERQPISRLAQLLIDRTLYRWKMKSLQHPDFRYKSEGEFYTPQELKETRLVAKNNNGLVFLTDVFAVMYPDATFFGLVRHPVPLYESYKRRGVPLTDFVHLYLKVTDKMLRDRDRFANYHLVKFEDLLLDPVQVMKQLYHLADVDFTKVKKVRLRAKPHLQPNGQYGTKEYVPGNHYWFDFEDIYQILEPSINAYQADRLDEEETNRLITTFEPILSTLGYPF